MILVDWQIRELCKHGLVQPFDEDLINPSSLDVRIGNTAMIETINGMVEKDISYATKENPLKLSPNEFILGCTLEYISLPEDIAAEIKLKSSRAREGFTHALAGWIDNGFHGVLTLELKNYLCQNTLDVYPGLRIGQLIFFKTESPAISYSNGRYAGHQNVLKSLDM